MKPVQQLFALVLEKIWLLQNKRLQLIKYAKNMKELTATYGEYPEVFEKKKEQLRCKEIKALLFDEYLRETNNEKNGNQSLTKFFTSK